MDATRNIYHIAGSYFELYIDIYIFLFGENIIIDKRLDTVVTKGITWNFVHLANAGIQVGC